MSANENENPQTATEGPLYGYLAEYKTPGELIEAAKQVRDAGFKNWDCYSPFPVHGLDPAMGIKMTILPWIVFVSGMTGLVGGLLLQWWTNAVDWPWIISGKPFFSLPANIPITFETTVLFSVFAAFFGMWGLNKLPQVWHPFFRNDRFLKATDDGFFIGIQADDDKFDNEKTKSLLEGAGAVAVDACHYDPDPSKKKMPSAVYAVIIISTLAALVPFAIAAKARNSTSTNPHWHIIPDMDFQPKQKTQSEVDPSIFGDTRALRLPVEGTVARGELKDNDLFYRGKENGEWAVHMPAELAIDDALLAEGKKKYDVFCAPCHGYSGHGDGIITKRTMALLPADLHQKRIVEQPHGQIFDTIGNGKGTMAGYAAQLNERERWSVVLYLRALQRSQK